MGIFNQLSPKVPPLSTAQSRQGRCSGTSWGSERGDTEGEVAPGAPEAGHLAAALRALPGGQGALQQHMGHSESFGLDADLRNVIRELIINSLCSC